MARGALSSCGAQASCCGGFSACGVQALGPAGFSSGGIWAQRLWHTGLVAPRHVGSSQTRDQTCVPCIGRWILNYWTTKEVPLIVVLICISLIISSFGYLFKIVPFSNPYTWDSSSTPHLQASGTSFTTVKSNCLQYLSMYSSSYKKKSYKTIYGQVISMLGNLSWRKKCYMLKNIQFSSVQFNSSVVSDSLRPHESQHAIKTLIASKFLC